MVKIKYLHRDDTSHTYINEIQDQLRGTKTWCRNDCLYYFYQYFLFFSFSFIIHYISLSYFFSFFFLLFFREAPSTKYIGMGNKTRDIRAESQNKNIPPTNYGHTLTVCISTLISCRTTIYHANSLNLPTLWTRVRIIYLVWVSKGYNEG